MQKKKTIPVFRPSFGKEEVQAVARVLESGWAGLGPKTAEFEGAFSEFVKAPYSVAVNSCTSALHCALATLDLRPGDEVITSPITFVSSAHAIAYCGAKPVFTDVEPDTLNMDPTKLEKVITKRTRAILCVHYAGHPCDISRLQSIAASHKIPLMEDAAHACGARYKGTPIGGTGNLTCFSFHAVKNLACGDGGMVTAFSKQTDRWLRKMRWLGIDKSTWNRALGKKYSWYYSVTDLGFKYHMNDITAAIGLVQLGKLERANCKRRRLVENYNRELSSVPWITLPVEKEYARSSWHIYKIEVPTRRIREKLIRYLNGNAVSAGVHYYPIHLHDFYQKQKRICLPVAEEKWQKIVTLPLFPDLSRADQERIIHALKKFSV